MINIISSFNDDYLLPAMCMIKSVLANTDPCNVCFYFTTNNLSARSQSNLIKVLHKNNVKKVTKLRVPFESLGGAKVDRHISIESYSKILLGEILPSNIKKVIYIDPDTIVTDNISKLMRVHLQAPIMAVQDCMMPVANMSPGIKDNNNVHTEYFNAGVLVVDLKEWRLSDISGRLATLSSSLSEDIEFHEQDVLNHFFQDKWQKLPLYWNSQSPIFQYQYTPILDHVERHIVNRSIINPSVVHFNGSSKPWNNDSTAWPDSLFEKYAEEVSQQHSIS